MNTSAVPSGGDARLLTASGSVLFFAGTETVNSATGLWVTGGAQATTQRVADIPSAANSMIAYRGGVALATDAGRYISDSLERAELWVSDGTTAGTVLVKSIGPLGFIEMGGALYFNTATSQPWKTDGTAAGTTLVKDFSIPNYTIPVFLVGAARNALYVYVNRQDLWRSDGTTEGTVFLAGQGLFSSVGSGIEYGGEFVFAAWRQSRDGGGVNQLWASDGSVAGTRRILDLTSYPGSFITSGGHLFFLGASGGSSYTLFGSDGTATGTVPVGAASDSYDWTPFRGGVFFSRGTGQINTTDGTVAGTALALRISVGDASAISDLTARGNEVFFFGTGTQDGANVSLWRTDGTATGTTAVAAVGTNAFLTLSHDAIGYADHTLWISDGTAAGTVLVKKLNSGGSDAIRELTPAGGTLFFTANDGTSGDELWKTDGTAAGTVRVKDINPGSTGSSPERLFAAQGVLYFTADDGVHGRELWAASVDVALDTTPPVLRCPAVVPVEASGSGAPATDAITASDDSGIPPLLTFSHCSFPVTVQGPSSGGGGPDGGTGAGADGGAGGASAGGKGGCSSAAGSLAWPLALLLGWGLRCRRAALPSIPGCV